MATFTLGTASQATGCAKSTILRAIKAGRISATRDELGQWSIEPVELFRCFPPLALPATAATAGQAQIERDATTDMLVTELRQVIADLRRGQEDLRQERDHWRTAHEREQVAHAATQRLLLPPPGTVPKRDAPAAGEGGTPNETPRNRLVRAWRWMRATGCLAGVGLLLALGTVDAGAQPQQAPQRQCFTVVMNHSTSGGSAGAILVDQCTGNTWQLIRVNLPGGGQTMRWFPITVEATEVTTRP